MLLYLDDWTRTGVPILLLAVARLVVNTEEHSETNQTRKEMNRAGQKKEIK